MKELNQQYELAKHKAVVSMKSGQISDYLNALLEMNKYKRLITAVVAN